MKKISSLITLLLCAVSLFAQAPEKFTYQAVVRNANNSLVANSQVGMRVSILQGSASGSAVYVETQTGTTNANGLVTLSIGGGSVQQGTFANIDWANGPFFLKTETDPNGGSNYTITTTQQLLSVPYALYAKTAENGFSGDYNDLTNKPQNVSVFNNDAEYITNAQLTALLSALNNRIDSLQTLLNMVAPENIDVMSCPEAPTMTDVEGNVYRTVKIGSQCWMRDNLRTTHYSDSTAIALVSGNSNYQSYTTPYCFDYSNSNFPLTERGYLYNWAAVMGGASSSNAVPSGVQGICPTGWHVPSNAEWTVLTDYLNSHIQYLCGDTGIFYAHAKSLATTTGWTISSGSYECAVGNNQSTNNATGFSGVPAGEFNGSLFTASGDGGYFWTTTEGPNEYSSYFAYHISLYFNYQELVSTETGKGDGYSVRCVRD